MTGSGSGPLGLLLMIAPLAAIPVFAIVGIPRFAPVSASQGDDEDAIEWREAVGRTDSAASESASKVRNSDDLFAPVTYPSSRNDTAGKRSSSESTSDQTKNSGRWLHLPPEMLHRPVGSSPRIFHCARESGSTTESGKIRQGPAGIKPADPGHPLKQTTTASYRPRVLIRTS